jgi:hypothetical protein
MTACPTEGLLVELATGDGDAVTRTHVAGCAPCGARLAALERDLSLLTATLRETPAPAVASRRRWTPLAAGAALSAALLLLTLAPWRATPPADVAGGESTTELAEALSAALFASAELDLATASSDADDLEAALAGGALCAGDDCRADTLYTADD